MLTSVMMHLGRNNPQSKYHMNNKVLEIIHEEKDLGVLISDMVESLRAGIHKGEQGARYDKQNDPQQRQKNSTQFIQILGKTSSGILFTCLVSTLHTIKRTNSYWRKFSIDLQE